MPRTLTALLLSTASLLMGCATAPTPAPVTVECPQVPQLELDAPERDWLGQMQRFLQGSLPMPPDYSLHSTPARLHTAR